MSYAFFLSERYLKNNTPMGDNVDVKDIYPYAKTAEDTYIQGALGSCLFDRLKDSLTASPADTTADETALLTKLRDALVYFTCVDALPFIWVKLRNIGLVKQGGDNMETASIAEMTFIQKQLRNKADFYLKLVQDYLCENGSLFPDYKCSCANCSSMNPNTSAGPSCALAFDKNDSVDQQYQDFYRKWIR